MLRFLLKIWPAFLPILIYILWIILIKNFLLKKLAQRSNIIDGKKIVGGKKTRDKESNFSLKNKQFVITLYASFFIAIITLILLAL